MAHGSGRLFLFLLAVSLASGRPGYQDPGPSSGLGVGSPRTSQAASTAAAPHSPTQTQRARGTGKGQAQDGAGSAWERLFPPSSSEDELEGDPTSPAIFASPIRKGQQGRTEITSLPEALRLGKARGTGRLWRDGSYQDWCDAQDEYQYYISRLGDRASELDRWFHSELPSGITERGSPQRFTKRQLGLLVEWACYHRGGCAQALDTVMGKRTDQEVEIISHTAFALAQNGDVQGALEAVARLLGEDGVTRDVVVIGSAMLASFDREMYPFMSEEAVASCPELWGHGWGLTCESYERLCVSVRRKANALNVLMVSRQMHEGRSTGRRLDGDDDNHDEAMWTAVDVVAAMWSALASEVESNNALLRGPALSPTHPPSHPYSAAPLGDPIRAAAPRSDSRTVMGAGSVLGEATPPMPATPAPPGGRDDSLFTGREQRSTGERGCSRCTHTTPGSGFGGYGEDWGGGGRMAARGGVLIEPPQTPHTRPPRDGGTPPPPPSPDEEATGDSEARGGGSIARWHALQEGEDVYSTGLLGAPPHRWGQEGVVGGTPPEFGRVVGTPCRAQSPAGAHVHKFAGRQVRQRVDAAVFSERALLDVGWAAGSDGGCSDVLYVLGRAARELDNLQVLRCEGLLALAECPDAFRALLVLIRKHPSLWALSLGGVPITAGQQSLLAHALRTTHVSHIGCEATGRLAETILGIATANARKHSMWLLGDDSRQNSVIREVSGCWEDPMDHPDNIVWLEQHARPRTPAPRTPRH